jgi:hypothetical protein
MSAKSINQLPQLSRAGNLVAIATLTASFLFISVLGSKLIYRAFERAPRYNARIAEGRPAAFPFAMFVVHLVGYRLWKRQYSPSSSDGDGQRFAVYRRPLKAALLQQAICFIVGILTLDGGTTANATTVALLAYWMSAGLIIARRLDKPTLGDLHFIRWAFLAIWLSAVIVGPMVWYRMEY